MRLPIPRWCKRLLCAIIFVYLVVGILLIIFQRSFVFVPFDGPTNPEEAGLTGFAEARIASADNIPSGIRYWYSSSAPTAPLLMYFHGNGGGLHAFTFALPHLQKQGYTVAAMEYRGYPGSSGTSSEKAIVEDAIRLTNALRVKHPNAPLVLWGYSLGSGVATQVAANIEGESALVLEAPFTSVVDRGAELWPLYPVRYFARDTFLSIDHIGGVNTPLFIMHGNQDWIVPASHSARLFAAAKEPKERRTYPDANHFTLAEHGAYEDAFTFIKAHTKH